VGEKTEIDKPKLISQSQVYYACRLFNPPELTHCSVGVFRRLLCIILSVNKKIGQANAGRLAFNFGTFAPYFQYCLYVLFLLSFLYECVTSIHGWMTLSLKISSIKTLF
jgi:hypothetical protein